MTDLVSEMWGESVGWDFQGSFRCFPRALLFPSGLESEVVSGGAAVNPGRAQRASGAGGSTDKTTLLQACCLSQTGHITYDPCVHSGEPNTYILWTNTPPDITEDKGTSIRAPGLCRFQPN